MAIAYLVKMFPRVSETFITNEIRELGARGLAIRPVSLMAPTVSAHWSDVAEIAAATHYLRDPASSVKDTLATQGWLVRRKPGRYLRTIGQVLMRFSMTSWRRFFQAGEMVRFCDAEGIRHVHAAFAHTPASVAFWTRSLWGLDYSFTAHAKDLYLADRRSLREKMNAARFVWTCTHANADYLKGIGSRVVAEVGYHGIDLDRWDSAAVPESADAVTEESGPRRFRILAVSRLVPKKGLSYLIEALARLRDQGREFELVLGGDGPERPRLESLIAQHRLEGRVTFTGTLSPSEVRQAYASAHLLVLPCVVLENGDRDGIPNVLVEAMAMGLPVVSTRISAVPELIEDGVTGRLVEERDSGALAEAIASTMDDPDQARRMAVRARLETRTRFDLQQNIESLASRLENAGRPLRGLYVNADLGIPVRGHKGAAAHVRQIAARIAEAGVELRVIAASAGPLPPEGNEFAPVIVEVRASALWTRLIRSVGKERRAHGLLKELRRLLHNFAMFSALCRAARDQRPEFLYERYALCAIAGGVFARLHRVPWILEVNAPLADEEANFRGLVLGKLTRFLERWILRSADHLYVVSHELRRWAIGAGVRPSRVAVLPNGVDGRIFHDRIEGAAVRAVWGTRPDETVILFSGSLKPWHGVHELVQAVEMLHKDGLSVRLVLVGDGPESKPLRKRIEKHGLGEFIHLTGSVPQREVAPLLAAADILAAPYLQQDGFYFSPLKLMEYLAVGRPVVASRVGDIPEWVDGSVGRLVPPDRTAALAQALAELVRDPELRVRLGQAASARVRGADWSDRAEEILDRVAVLRGSRPEPEVVRVGYVLKMFPRFSETFVLREVLELERQGVELRMFSMKVPSGPRQEGVERVRARTTILAGMEGLRSPAVMGAILRCLWRHPRGFARALRFTITRKDRRAYAKFIQATQVADACARESIGHLHAHFASGPTRVAKIAWMISGVPYSFTAHAKDLYWEGHNHGGSSKLKKRVQWARFVAVISEENKRFIEGLGFKVKEGRIRPLYIGLELDQYLYRAPSARARSPRPLVLAIGRLIEKKGFHVLLGALAILKRRDVKFRCLIAGEGPEEGRLRETMERLGLDGAVRLLGPVPLRRLRERYYARARVLVQPCVVGADGDRDGIPTVLLEAMGLGVPIVSTRLSGIPEAIEDGVDGFLTEPGDVELLAERIELLLTDSGVADRIAASARARAERQFDLRYNVGALYKLFHRSVRGWPALTAVSAPGPDISGCSIPTTPDLPSTVSPAEAESTHREAAARSAALIGTRS